MEDDKLAIEEARRAQQHGSVKSQVEGEVQAEIAERAAADAAGVKSRRIQQVAGEFRAKAVDEVVDTEREVERGARRGANLASHRLHLLSCSTRCWDAFSAGLAGGAQQRRLCSVYRGGDESVLCSVSRHRCQSQHQRADTRCCCRSLSRSLLTCLLHLAINGLLRMIAHRKTEI